MCDFHSICVRRDGAIAHIPENSHSGAIEKLGWRENDQIAAVRGPFFVEAEWSCQGEFPGVDRITRGSSLNEKQRKVIENHYTNLAKLLADPAAHAERMLFNRGFFSGEEYADIRWKILIHTECPKRVADKLAETSLYAMGDEIKSLHPLVKRVDGSFSIAEKYEITAPALTKSGSVYVQQGATFTAPALTKSGYVDVQQGATFTAPALTEVSGSVYVQQGATFTAPKLNRSQKY